MELTEAHAGVGEPAQDVDAVALGDAAEEGMERAHSSSWISAAVRVSTVLLSSWKRGARTKA